MAVAPLVEKVRQRTLLGFTCVFLRICPTRRPKTSVLPVPGPAITITGPSIVSTALLWPSFNRAMASANFPCLEIISCTMTFAVTGALIDDAFSVLGIRECYQRPDVKQNSS